ncbi:MAG: lipid-A-disaccharide synthase [Planctomycetaceae bacterium]|nr:lipid-A-disaccharide synthase [Planctomycetaceae bacterium]
MHVFFSAGEPSGDQHGAELMELLGESAPGARFSGFGGPDMEAAGLQSLYRLTDLAVMGFGQVLPMLAKFRGLVKQAEAYLAAERPDAVVLIDFPGFNWWIAKAAKKAGIPVYFYCPPQLWAWAPWRIRKVRKYVDCILSVLPFEAEWYRQRGVDVEYVGHPFFDEVAHHPLDETTLSTIRQRSDRNVALLPGSRKQEVNRNFPAMLMTIRKLTKKYPEVRFPVACYKEWHFNRCRELLSEAEDLPVDLYLSKTPEVIEAADMCYMVSGSVSLELLARRTPAVVMYRGGYIMGNLAKVLVTCKYMSLPNLIADRSLFPEFPFMRPTDGIAQEMADALEQWLGNPWKLAQIKQELNTLADGIVQAGGVSRAADVLISRITNSTSQRRAA